MYDVTGKVLRVYEIEGLKGLNTKVINKSELNGNGVIYYQLDAANYTATKRMIDYRVRINIHSDICKRGLFAPFFYCLILRTLL
jgi:hypothetical protein